MTVPTGRSAGMRRTRAALLDAAQGCVERDGVRRTTMGGLAAAAGVAKATLYNHFRTKDDVLAALVEDRVTALAAQAADRVRAAGLVAALDDVAAQLAALPALRRVAAEEPALLVPLLVPGDGPAWVAARRGAAEALEAAGVPGDEAAVELVLRWCASQLLWPATGSAVALVSGVAAPAGASAPPGAGRQTGTAQAAGLGWPG